MTDHKLFHENLWSCTLFCHKLNLFVAAWNRDTSTFITITIFWFCLLLQKKCWPRKILVTLSTLLLLLINYILEIVARPRWVILQLLCHYQAEIFFFLSSIFNIWIKKRRKFTYFRRKLQVGLTNQWRKGIETWDNISGYVDTYLYTNTIYNIVYLHKYIQCA